ncbi:hypothetical protein PM082_005099 [Marasmius tenuissimus]|nr:hypothetical protein PM082_005099 [Marasmius tenuissimus]
MFLDVHPKGLLHGITCDITLACIPERDQSYAIDVDGPSFRTVTFSDIDAQIKGGPAAERLGEMPASD